jgi:hypothetical protein
MTVTNPSKAKGDNYERDVRVVSNDPDGALATVGLTMARTRAGYERDHGDLHVLTPDRQLVAACQAKNRREWRISAWLDQTITQAHRARAHWAVLIVKRPRVPDPLRSFAIMELAGWLRMVAALHEAERRARVAEETLAALREQGVQIPRQPRLPAGLTASERDVVRALTPAAAILDEPAAPGARVRPFGPHGLNGDREQGAS